MLDRKIFERLTLIESGRAVECDEMTLQLIQQGLVTDDLMITEQGLTALEPYCVKRAVFLAAGFGSRLVPLTLNTPKPLVKVHGIRMIDTLLDAVVQVGIEEIIVVRGYLKDKFDELLEKYPQIQFVDNLQYDQANNISSAYCVRNLFENAYVLEADLVLSNPSLITKYQYTTNYLGVKTDKTDDWCFKVDENNIIQEVLIGGQNVHHMYGISYWNQKDGKQLGQDIKTIFEQPNGKHKYWDEVALTYCKENYCIEVRECTFDDIVEIDSYEDLRKVEFNY